MEFVERGALRVRAGGAGHVADVEGRLRVVLDDGGEGAHGWRVGERRWGVNARVAEGGGQAKLELRG